jgi:outer membrane protein OmpA-like peptidoglycan-associated protein
MKKFFSFLVSIVVAVTAAGQNKCIVYFDSGKSDLKPETVRRLDSLADVISKGESTSFTIAAYCDNTGDEESNKILSGQRANAVASYFRSKNTLQLNITAEGKGEIPAENNTEEGKAKNRRAEISFSIKPKASVPGTPSVLKEEAKKEEEPGASKKPEVLSDKISIAEMQVGKTLVLQNLNFVGGTSQLLPEATPSLETLLKLMKDNPTLEIEIEGHVCCANDMPLSIRRALTVYDYLVSKGISEKRLRYQGHSNEQPITEERDEQERIMNRRVEIKIMKK